MLSNCYHFVTQWRLEGTVEEVSDIIGDPLGLVHWWPSVYLEVREIQPGDDHGIGKTVSLLTKGWLPYTLRWQFRVTESCAPFGYSLEAWGDLVGRGIWTFEQDSSFVDITYDWQIRADKPFLKYLSVALKPIFVANHRWAMKMGYQSLSLEIARRRAISANRDRIPPPAGPTSIRCAGLFLLVFGFLILTWLAVVDWDT